jgi:hypothetical protein
MLATVVSLILVSLILVSLIAVRRSAALAVTFLGSVEESGRSRPAGAKAPLL